MAERRPYRPLLIIGGAPKSIRAIGAEAVPLGILQRPLVNFGLNRVMAGRVSGLHTVETIGQPVVRAVVEDCHGRKLSARPHGYGVVLNGLKVERGPGLGAAVHSDSGYWDGLPGCHRPPPRLAGASPASMKAARISAVHWWTRERDRPVCRRTSARSISLNCRARIRRWMGSRETMSRTSMRRSRSAPSQKVSRIQAASLPGCSKDSVLKRCAASFAARFFSTPNANPR